MAIRRLKALVVVVLLTLGVVVQGALPAHGCTCMMPDPFGGLAEADGAFVGTLVEVDRSLSGITETGQVIDFRFEVEATLKGEIGDAVLVKSAASGASCLSGGSFPSSFSSRLLQTATVARRRSYSASSSPKSDLRVELGGSFLDFMRREAVSTRCTRRLLSSCVQCTPLRCVQVVGASRVARGSPEWCLEPPDEGLDTAKGACFRVDELSERVDEHRYVIPCVSREPPRVSEHQPRMFLTGSRHHLVYGREVLNVLGHEDPALGSRGCNELAIRETDHLGTFLDRNRVATVDAELHGNRWAVHLVEQQLHPDSSRRSASHAASSRSAASSLAAICASISSGYSA